MKTGAQIVAEAYGAIKLLASVTTTYDTLLKEIDLMLDDPKIVAKLGTIEVDIADK